jgi:menaquinone-dependent protoporphyrinogen IX oxidase
MRRCAAVLGLSALLLWSGACSKETQPPLKVDGGLVTLDNRTSSDWTTVEIWVNDHYRVVVPTVLAGQRFTTRLDNFVAGFGQRFDNRHQSVFGIEVTAKSANGDAVKLTWGKGRRQ